MGTANAMYQGKASLMPFSIDSTNDLQAIADKHFTTKCPHCNTQSGLSLVSAPRYEYMHRFKSGWVGFAYRCDACNQPVFLKFRVVKLSAPVLIDEDPIEIERPAESFELQHLPNEVSEDFKEALICYSNSCWNAFAAMTRRTLQSATTHLGGEGSTKVQQQLEDMRQMGVVEEEGFEQLKAIMLAGHDGAHPHLPKLSAERAAVVLELAKDALYQLFVRKAKIQESVRLRSEAVKSQQQDDNPS